MSILLAFVLVFTAFAMVACKGGEETTDSKIRFWYYGDATANKAYEAMVKAYNNGQGKIDGVEVASSPKPESGYISLIEQSAQVKTGPDVFFAWDRLYKKWTFADMTTDLTDYVAAAEADGSLDIDAIWTDTVNRFRYNKELNMSGENEDIYGLPVDTSPTALYYNKTAMGKVGVKVISVAAEDMEKWNNNEIADKYGNKKSDLGITVTVPKKGFFRSDNKQYLAGGTWIMPAEGTVMVFNDQIAMNWDEIEDLGALLTKDTSSKNTNTTSPTEFGYYTEWWFNYGWSVGGDCVEDMSGNGSWTYTHGDATANYIVNEGKTYTGAITGKEYKAGETIEFLDKLDVAVGDKIFYDNKGGYVKGGEYNANGEYVGGTKIGSWNGTDEREDSAIRQEVKDKVADGTLSELPSIREAFSRFTRLAGQSGTDLNICPYPSSFSTTSSIQYFTSGNVAMIVERGFNIPVVEEYVGDSFEWAVAPLPRYKEYANPTDCADDTVKVQGKIAGHSESTALVIRKMSDKKDASWKFIKWMVGPEAQAIKASYGFIPNQEEKGTEFLTALDPEGKKNAQNFLNAAAYETPGDWWYMVDRDWIDVWASPLNSRVRNGKLTLAEYFSEYVPAGNTEVFAYGNYGNDLGAVKNYKA